MSCCSIHMQRSAYELTPMAWDVPFGKVPSVLVQRVIAREDVDSREHDLVRGVVDIKHERADSLVAAAQVDFVEDLRGKVSVNLF